MSNRVNPSEATTGNGEARLIKPDEADDDGLVAGQGALVAYIERVAPAVREAQLDHDRDDLRRMQLEHFAGRTWDRKQVELFQYGQRVLPTKIKTGQIFAIMRDVGVPMARDLSLPAGPPLTPHEADELTTDVGARALLDFRRLLTAGVWDPYREDVACMGTFYVGKCALEFRAPWRSFLRRRKRRLEIENPTGLIDRISRQVDFGARTESTAIAKVELSRVLGSIEHRLRQVVVLDAYGFRDKEIAGRLGLTRKQVEYRLKKARRLLESLREVGDVVA
jgi:hypothetical protein